MPYTVSNADGSLTISVADSTVDTSTYSLALVGRNVSNYGAYFVQNAIRHLENFAGSTAPTPGTTLTGQLWYDKGEEVLRVYDGSTWKRATNILVGSAPSTNLVAGTAYFNTVLDKLYVHDGTSFKVAGYSGEVSSAYSATTNIGSPTNYGTKLRNIFLKDTSGVDRAVLALVYVNDSSDGAVNQGTTTTVNGKETLMAVFSDHAQFTVANSANNTEGESINWYAELIGSGGLGATIRPGLNLRTEYSTTALALSERAYRADAAYVLNTGSVGSDGGNIAAGTVWHDAKLTYEPSADNTAVLGGSSSKFASAYVGTIYLGNGTSGSILPNGTSVTIGSNTATAVNHVYANSMTVNETINFDTANLATSGSPVLNAFTANITVSTALNTPSITHTGTDGVGDIGQSGNKFGTVYATTFSGEATSALYADLAEIYASDAEYAPGTVVKLGGNAEITQTTSVEDLNVFGVISTDPAYLMNSGASGLPVALTGRVPVKVVGKVLKGERLVSSHLPGVAMALGFGEYDPRKVIGRSLEQKDSDDLGVVEAVIGVK